MSLVRARGVPVLFVHVLNRQLRFSMNQFFFFFSSVCLFFILLFFFFYNRERWEVGCGMWPSVKIPIFWKTPRGPKIKYMGPKSQPNFISALQELIFRFYTSTDQQFFHVCIGSMGI